MGLYMNKHNLLTVAVTPSKNLFMYIVSGALHLEYLMCNNYNCKTVSIYNLRKYTSCTVN